VSQVPPVLSIVVPCYNEEEVLPISTPHFCALLARLVEANKLSPHSHVIFVDDGSADKTWAFIDEQAKTQKAVQGLKLSRNRGHQNAALAGMLEATGDIRVTIDADLQDDIDAIEAMVDAYTQNGAEIVYGVRRNRDSDTAFKRFTAESYYKIVQSLGVEVVFNHADFRLLSRRAVEAFEEFEEVNLFLRGVVPLLGFKTEIVEYDRSERAAGESKYPLKKMLSLAWDGVTSFSIVPLRLITSLGLLVAMIAFLASLISIFIWVSGETVSGWTSLIVAISFFSGIQLLAIGVIGEYVGKVYLETKRRPRYIVQARTPTAPQTATSKAPSRPSE